VDDNCDFGKAEVSIAQFLLTASWR